MRTIINIPKISSEEHLMEALELLGGVEEDDCEQKEGRK